MTGRAEGLTGGGRTGFSLHSGLQCMALGAALGFDTMLDVRGQPGTHSDGGMLKVLRGCIGALELPPHTCLLGEDSSSETPSCKMRCSGQTVNISYPSASACSISCGFVHSTISSCMHSRYHRLVSDCPLAHSCMHFERVCLAESMTPHPSHVANLFRPTQHPKWSERGHIDVRTMLDHSNLKGACQE